MDRASLIAAMEASAAPKPVPVAVSGWGTVYVRPLTIDEVDSAPEAKGEDAKKHRLARAAARLLCDETGARLFDETNPDDVALLSAQPWSMLQPILEAGGGKRDEAGN